MRETLLELIAYKTYQNRLGGNIVWLADKIQKLQHTDSVMDNLVHENDNNETTIWGESRAAKLAWAKGLLSQATDPRYIKNPFYRENNHRHGRFHGLFDRIKEQIPDNADKPQSKD